MEELIVQIWIIIVENRLELMGNKDLLMKH